MKVENKKIAILATDGFEKSELSKFKFINLYTKKENDE